MIALPQADALTRLALAGLDREFPNKPAEVLAGPEHLRSPRDLHPAFYGCFDWHSSVHGHWLLARLLRLQPGMPSAGEARTSLASHLTASNLLREAACFDRPGHRSFERPYGWAWLLRLIAELHSWPDPDAAPWRENLRPLESRIVALACDYLVRLTYPVRTGVHPDTGFALGQFLDYARVVGAASFEQRILERARHFFLADRDYPDAYEPSGEDFFSSGLNEADLMRRVLPGRDFAEWLRAFAPRLGEDGGPWRLPARVSDLTDPKITHLVGLNLSRAWTLQGIAHALPSGDARRARVELVMEAHAREGLSAVFSGHYEGEHWLGTFAVYYLTRVGLAGD